MYSTHSILCECMHSIRVKGYLYLYLSVLNACALWNIFADFLEAESCDRHSHSTEMEQHNDKEKDTDDEAELMYGQGQKVLMPMAN